MAKFKKGDKVVSTSGNRGVVDEVYDHEQYAVRFDGRSMPDRVEGFKLRAANSAAALSRNSVVANALAWKKDNVVVVNTPMKDETQVYSQGVGARVTSTPNPSWEIKLGCRGDCLVFYSDKSMDSCIEAAQEHIAYMDEIKKNLLKAIAWMKKHG